MLIELGAIAVLAFVASVCVFISACNDTRKRRAKASREFNARVNALIWRWAPRGRDIYGRQ